RTSVKASPASVRPAHGAKLHGKKRLMTAALQSLGNEQFVSPHAVKVAGVDQVDAAVERGMDGCNAFVVVRFAVDAGHSHTAQSDGINRRSVGPELTMLKRGYRHD